MRTAWRSLPRTERWNTATSRRPSAHSPGAIFLPRMFEQPRVITARRCQCECELNLMSKLVAFQSISKATRCEVRTNTQNEEDTYINPQQKPHLCQVNTTLTARRPPPDPSQDWFRLRRAPRNAGIYVMIASIGLQLTSNNIISKLPSETTRESHHACIWCGRSRWDIYVLVFAFSGIVRSVLHIEKNQLNPTLIVLWDFYQKQKRV